MNLSVFQNVMKDITTTPNGDYDPARVVGYGVVVLGALVFFGCTIYLAVVKQEFDGANYAIGMAGVAASIAAAAGGVYMKKTDEIPYDPEKTPAAK